MSLPGRSENKARYQVLTCFLYTSYLMLVTIPGRASNLQTWVDAIGCSTAGSDSNLQTWLDAIGCSTARSDALVKKIDGTRLHGAYHHMLQWKHLSFMRALQSLSA